MENISVKDGSIAISFKLSRRFLARIDELAKYIGISRSELIRQALFEYITDKIVKMRCIIDEENQAQ